jgi:hypothetical protein
MKTLKFLPKEHVPREYDSAPSVASYLFQWLAGESLGSKVHCAQTFLGMTNISTAPWELIYAKTTWVAAIWKGHNLL